MVHYDLAFMVSITVLVTSLTLFRSLEHYFLMAIGLLVYTSMIFASFIVLVVMLIDKITDRLLLQENSRLVLCASQNCNV